MTERDRILFGSTTIDYEPLYYSQDEKFEDGCFWPHGRKVKWNKQPLVRQDLSVPLQNTMKAAKTVLRVSHKEEFLVAIGVQKRQEWKPDPYKAVLEQILELSANDFEDLVKDLLVALSFDDPKVTGGPGDGGVDVTGELTTGNLIRLKMFVQVKRYRDNKVNVTAVPALRGSIPMGGQGAVITTSEFDNKAKEAANSTEYPYVGLIHGRQLVDLLVERWHAESMVKWHDRLGLSLGLVLK